MGRGYLVVEGHGDGQAALNLVIRFWQTMRLATMHWADPIRGKNLHQERGIRKAADLIRSKHDAAVLLILRDEDDGCPKDLAPTVANWLRNAQLPFPSAVVLAHREFEAFFLPCIHLIAGKPLVGPTGVVREGLLPGTTFVGDPEAVRGVKEWLSRHMPGGRSYKPTLDQLPMARFVDFTVLRTTQPPLPCFGSMERALRFLDGQIISRAAGVYPVGASGNSPSGV